MRKFLDSQRSLRELRNVVGHKPSFATILPFFGARLPIASVIKRGVIRDYQPSTSNYQHSTSSQTNFEKNIQSKVNTLLSYLMLEV